MRCFRCPLDVYAAMVELCEADDVAYSDFVCQALLMYTDYAERTGVITLDDSEDCETESEFSAE